MELKDRLRELRGNLTQVQFGQKVGLSGATISTSESGKTRPDRQTLEVIAMKCGVRYDWLASGEEPKWPEQQDNDLAVAISRAVLGDNENKKKLLRILADMPDQLLDEMMKYLESKLK